MPANTRVSLFLKLTVFFAALSSTIEARRPGRLAIQAARRDAPIDLSAYIVPLSNGTASLPAPTATLKAITLGRGTQNYTCNGTDPTPLPIGAIATLLDASPLLPLLPSPDATPILDLLPAYLVNFDFASITNFTLPILGHHFFNQAAVPCFQLGSLGNLEGKKVAGGDIAAPGGASPGPEGVGFGAVDWLKLVAGEGSEGIREVYRVETAGGRAPKACSGFEGVIEVQYAALYWFYG